MLDSLKNFRRNYLETLKALPFLDCYFSDMPASWDDAPKEPVTPYRKLSFTEGNPRLVKQTDHSFEEIAERLVEIEFISLRRGDCEIDGEVEVDRADIGELVGQPHDFGADVCGILQHRERFLFADNPTVARR